MSWQHPITTWFRSRPVQRRILLHLTLSSLFIMAVLVGLKNSIETAEAYYGQPIPAVRIQAKTFDNTAWLTTVLTGTPMEPAIADLASAAEHYDIPVQALVGIANAESSLRTFRCFNPWGVDSGKGNDPRCYTSWEHSANAVSHLLRFYYFNEGKDTPEKIMRKYVGYDHPQWVKNVRGYWNR